MFCENCGKEVSEGSRFCPHCGKSISMVFEDNETEYAGTDPSDMETIVCGENSAIVPVRPVLLHGKCTEDDKKSIKAAVIMMVIGLAALAFYVGIPFFKHHVGQEEIAYKTDAVKESGFDAEESFEDEMEDAEENENQPTHYNVGDIVTFGNYGEAVEWIVLASDDEKALLWAKYCVAAQKYNNAWLEEVSWETCTLRQWLNMDFMHEAFGVEEQNHIIRSTLENVDCGVTEDYIFILSAKDVEDYVAMDSWRIGYPTNTAISQEISVDSGTYNQASAGKCRYWIRGNYNGEPYDGGDWVDCQGEIQYDWQTNDKSMGVRPAFWYCYEASETNPSSDSDYIVEDSSERYLLKRDLEGLSQEQLRLARNEIYARHGYQFRSEELKEYFSSKTWYYPRIEDEDFLECYLNIYEKYNVEVIMAAENGTDYTGELSNGYDYEEISENVAIQFAGDMDVTFFSKLCGKWDSYEDGSIIITAEEFDGHPWRLLKFEYNTITSRYYIVAEVYYEDDIKIMYLITKNVWIDGGFDITYYDRYGNLLTENGYEVDSVYFWQHYGEMVDDDISSDANEEDDYYEDDYYEEDDYEDDYYEDDYYEEDDYEDD